VRRGGSHEGRESGNNDRKKDMTKATNAPKPNVFSRMAGYVSDVRSELRRVVWPTRNEVLNLSIVVIITLAFFVVFTFIIDSASVYVMGLISRIGG